MRSWICVSYSQGLSVTRKPCYRHRNLHDSRTLPRFTFIAFYYADNHFCNLIYTDENMLVSFIAFAIGPAL